MRRLQSGPRSDIGGKMDAADSRILPQNLLLPFERSFERIALSGFRPARQNEPKRVIQALAKAAGPIR